MRAALQAYARQSAHPFVRLKISPRWIGSTRGVAAGGLLTNKQHDISGLNLSALAEAAVATALARRDREKLQADIVQACQIQDQHLAEYGSLADALRANIDE